MGNARNEIAMKCAWFAFMFMCVCSQVAYSCTDEKGSGYPSLKADGGFVVFDEVLLGESERTSIQSDEMGINVGFYDCITGTKNLIGELPYLASTGKVEAAFFADANRDGVDELFVLHRVGIRSDTGVLYAGDYYTVLIYSKSSQGYSINNRISNYFGRGGDILADRDESNLAYEFPYKSEKAIRQKLSATNYLRWLQGNTVEFLTKHKTLLYETPILSDGTINFLPEGTSVIQNEVEAGWISVTSDRLGDSGWVRCGDIDAC